MALPSSGQITMNDMNTDRGISSGTQIDLASAGTAYSVSYNILGTDQLGMDEFYGRSIAAPPPPPPPPAIPTYAITGSPTVVNEGSSVTFTIVTTDVGNGTVLYWTTNAPDGELNTPSAGDFTDNTTEGIVTINSNAGSFIRTLVEDSSTEGDEVFVIKLRQDSTSGAVLATSNTVIIGDTSLSPPPPPPPPPPAPCFLLTSIGSNTSPGGVCNTPRSLSGYFSTTSINSSTLYYGPSNQVSNCDGGLWPTPIYLQGDGGYYYWNGSSMSGPFTCL
jgi:hypothetical protein